MTWMPGFTSSENMISAALNLYFTMRHFVTVLPLQLYHWKSYLDIYFYFHHCMLFIPFYMTRILEHGADICTYIWSIPGLKDIEAQHLHSRAISFSEPYCDPPPLRASAMDQLLAQRTLSLLHHLMRLVLQLHGSILANIEGLEGQFGHRGTTLPAHHPYSSSMAPMDTPILLPGISTTSTHSALPSTTASLHLYQPSLHRPHPHATKRTLSPQPHPPSTKHHRINPRADTPAPPATPKTADPDDSTSHHSLTAAPSRPSPHFTEPRAIPNPATEPTPTPAPEPSPPESPIGTIPAPWSSQEDETLISLKSDSRARPSWASVGARMRRTPSECKARWQLLRLQQTAPSETTPPPPLTSTNPGPPRPPTRHP